MRVKNKPNEIYISRVYDAPVKAVWEAWTDEKQAAKWWGPRGFTITTHSKDLKPGGTWHYTMHGPDGTDYPNMTKYHEVEKHSRLVYDHGGYIDKPPLFQVTVEFSEVKGKTKMEMTMALATAEAAQQTKKFIKSAGGNGTWDRLAEYLEKESTGNEKFFINRTFEAPIEKMFEMWTDPKHFSKWLAPVGFEMDFLRSEIKPGSSTFYKMSGQGFTMYGHCNYLEITKPNKIVYTQDFCDENEKPSRHPGLTEWPPLMHTTVLLTAESADQTRVTIEWTPHRNSTQKEIEAFVNERAGMTQGWTGSFDKLEDYLPTV